ncbi:hypothetical protein F8M41_012805 [Gigaspora margarita]|uniref:Uncharacterized protein n=1 Tax=Gigaspora margarita TaxID=4874 RepID=A0A8H4B3Q9_GIGMA|nr:hypothetical protein F8M41_012805 [Gigaspora margarita]
MVLTSTPIFLKRASFFRQSEKRVFKIFRIIFICFTYVSVFIYMCWKFSELSKGEKMLIYTRETLPYIATPNLYFASSSNFSIFCEYSFNGFLYNGSRLHCTQRIQYGFRSSFAPFMATFKPNGLRLNNNLSSNPPNMTGINFDTNQTEFSNITSVDFIIIKPINQTIQLLLWAFDPEMDPYSDRNLFTKEPNLMYEFIKSNEYQVGTGYNQFRFSKRIRRMLINKASSLFSWQAQYKEIPYITSEMENIRENISLGVSTVQISCLSTIVETDSEKLILTLLDVFGFIGGLFTLLTSIFVILFGQNKRSPWGILHFLSCCSIKQKTQNSLYDYLKDQIPFADEGVHLDYPPAKIEDRISAIEQRHKALELFLQDYVVNVNILYDKDVDNRFYKYTEIQDDKTI